MNRPISYLRRFWDTALGMTLCVAILILLAMALSACGGLNTAHAQVPPEVEALTGEEWHVDTPAVLAGSTATGDTFLSLGRGAQLRARVDDTTYVKCEETGAPLFSTVDLQQTADSVLYHGAPYDAQSLWVRRAECVTTFRALADSL